MDTTPEQPKDGQENTKPRKRSFLKKLLIGSGLFLLFLFIAAGCFLGWICQSTSGQAWLVEKLNNALASEAGKPGIRITSLQGSLPFNFTFGLELEDQNGIWLNAPDNQFILNWKELPKAVHLSALKITSARMNRLPSFPESDTPAEPAKPLTIKDIQLLLKDTATFLNADHWWLPNIILEGIEVNNFLLPPDLLPENTAPLALNASLSVNTSEKTPKISFKANSANDDKSPVNLGSITLNEISAALDMRLTPENDHLALGSDLNINISEPIIKINSLPGNYLGENAILTLKLDANVNTSDQKPGVEIRLEGPELQAGQATIQTTGSWASGTGWQSGQIDGPIRLRFHSLLNPLQANGSALNLLRSPAVLDIDVQGNFPAITLNVKTACDKIVYEDYSVENLDLSIASNELDIPLTREGLEALTSEKHVNIALSALLNEEKISLMTQAFFQAFDQPGLAEKEGADLEKRSWLAGLRNLQLDALGIAGKGDLMALLAPYKMPVPHGNLSIGVNSWNAINKFLPGKTIAGDLNLKLAFLANKNRPDNLNEKTGPENWQNLEPEAEIALVSNKLSISLNPGEILNISSLKLNAIADNFDNFQELAFNSQMQIAKIGFAKMNLGAQINAKGALKGPLRVQVNTQGSINSKIDASWEPGKAILNTLSVQANVRELLPAQKPSKNGILGLKMEKTATVAYGDGGINVSGLDISLLPSGHLSASGTLAPEKLDFNLKLDRLDFQPWHTLVPQVPSGSARLQVNLAGTPKRPSGRFHLAVADVKLPGVNLAPVSLTLQGGIENGSASALSLRLNLDQSTMQALGGSIAQVTARIPLIFEANGVPKPDLAGAFSAAVRWDGALGPICNLLPIADQRLNGRIAIDLNADGSLQKPRIKGGLRIEKGRYENILYGVLLTEINLKLNLTENGQITTIKNNPSGLPGGFTLDLGLTDGRGGIVTIRGKGNLNGSGLDIKTNINRLKPLRRRDIHIELSGDLTANGSAFSPNVAGAITVNRGEILLNNLDIASTSVTTLPITEPGNKQKNEQTKEGAPAQVGHLNIHIIIPPRFTVEGRGLGSIWQANLMVEGTLTDPKITGTINAYSGNFDFLGKNFALTKGIVTFAGGSLANPLLNIELTNETPDLTAHIMITGPVNKMRLTLTSDPNLPRDDILSRVLFGKSVNDLSRLEALQLAGAVAQLAGFGSSGGLLSSAKKALGVDVLRIGTSSSNAAGEGEEGAGGTNIEMGKYINDMIYMGVQQGLQQDSTAFIIQMELTPRTSLELRSEDNNTWGGLNWKYNY